MPHRSVDACFYVTTSPDIELRDGTFMVGYDIGKQARFEIAMPPHIFLKALKEANRVADQFHEGGTVVPMRRRS